MRAPGDALILTCCSTSMLELSKVPASRPVVSEGEVLLGKRYTNPDSSLEVLCIKAGTGPLFGDGRRLEVKLHRM